MAPKNTMKLELYGLIGNIDFMRAKCCAQDIIDKNVDLFPDAQIRPMVEFEWRIFLEEKKRILGGETWPFQEPAMAFVDDKLIGGPNEFVSWAMETVNFEDFRPEALYDTITEQEYVNFLNSRKHEFVYMDISVNSEPVGRLIIELFSDIVPKTCENFRSLCTGERGESEHSVLEIYQLSYRGHQFHRIVPHGWIQGGDIWHDKGNGGESIYGLVFEDENFAVKHNKRGIVGMANKGRHTNGSQFYITLQATPWMDKKYVAFGQVIEGMDTLNLLESLPTLIERPKKVIKIEDCGQLSFKY